MVNLSVNFLIKSLSPVSLSNSVSAFGFSCSLVKHRNITYYAGHHNVLCFNFSRAASGIVACGVGHRLLQGNWSSFCAKRLCLLIPLQRYDIFPTPPNFGTPIRAICSSNWRDFVELASARQSRCEHHSALAYSQPWRDSCIGQMEGGCASLSKPVVEFVELWNPFPQIPQSSQVENKTHEFRCSFIYYQLH